MCDNKYVISYLLTIVSLQKLSVISTVTEMMFLIYLFILGA